jgi:hypothetical protein
MGICRTGNSLYLVVGNQLGSKETCGCISSLLGVCVFLFCLQCFQFCIYWLMFFMDLFFCLINLLEGYHVLSVLSNEGNVS